MPRASDQSSDFHTPQRLIPCPEVLSCPSCGRENPASHQFCGSCGATLPVRDRAANDYPDGPGLEVQRPQPAEEKRREPEPFEHSITNPNELSLFRSFRPSDSGDGYWEDEPRSPYRVYIALVLVLMIAGLGYMAWRTSKSGSQNAHEAPPAPVSAEKAPAPASNSPSHEPEASAPKAAEPAANTPAAPSRKSADTAKATAPAKTPATDDAGTAETPHAQTLADNGSAELAEANRYLAARDNAEASKWLWKSIAKHNGEATVLLADLYLKGDGVSKNCDQARVLLDSAARKGVAGAGERLRNLPAFGCQ